MIRHRVLSCQNLVSGLLAFEVALRTEKMKANCDVVLYSVFENTKALAV